MCGTDSAQCGRCAVVHLDTTNWSAAIAAYLDSHGLCYLEMAQVLEGDSVARSGVHFDEYCQQSSVSSLHIETQCFISFASQFPTVLQLAKASLASYGGQKQVLYISSPAH